MKIERRREQNRLAAHKFRQKKKECGNSLCKVCLLKGRHNYSRTECIMVGIICEVIDSYLNKRNQILVVSEDKGNICIQRL